METEFDVSYEFDPFEIAGDKDAKRRMSSEQVRNVLEEVADYVKTQVLLDVASLQSPVQGKGVQRNFEPLTKEYKAFKQASGRPGVPDLTFDGDMLSALNAEVTDNKVKLFVESSQAAKADGHNNHSGLSPFPKYRQRKFVPNADAGETFVKKIRQGIKEIVQNSAPQEPEESLTESAIRELISEGLGTDLLRENKKDKQS